MSFRGFGRTSQIRTGDLYYVNIDGCTNVRSSANTTGLHRESVVATTYDASEQTEPLLAIDCIRYLQKEIRDHFLAKLFADL